MRSEEEAEFREFVVARAQRLRRLAYLMCGDWHRAEDAVQTAFVRLFGAWGRAKRDSLDGYARRIVINTVIDEHRLGWFRRERPRDRLPDHTSADPAEASVRKIAVMNALAQLPDRQRAVIVLRFWEDQSVEETARIMRCSAGTVKSHTARGLRTLRALLAQSIHECIEENHHDRHQALARRDGPRARTTDQDQQ